MGNIHFAIIGCGHIAKKHIESIRNIKDAEITAICDTNPDRLLEFQAIYGVKGYSSLEELLAKESCIDVVNVCTPSGLHKGAAVRAAQAKKHVIVEKPIAMTVADADEIINACKHYNVKLAVVHPNRFRPAIQEMKKALDSGWFGKLSYVHAAVRWNRDQNYYNQAAWRGTRALDGGVLMNQAIHNLDLLLWLIGPVKKVQALMDTRIRHIETEDVALALLQFEDGTLGMIEATTTVYPRSLEESISIFGEKGTAIVGGTTANWIKHWAFEECTADASSKLVKRINEEPYGVSGHQAIIADMIEAIRQDRQPLVSGADGKNVVQLVLSIYEAAERDSRAIMNP
ncbi:Gfo/Idh/MocA family protein [Aneurinibacillus danicus]|jgi:predicted dehydrogenase|uniref:Oxidoreductase n=1 Tax=Aneurinibacillus danicus TaxID=267746 RepID=A0A511V5G4_9BACL|nr:Gfo/Idh/MocA family oxidoreductase [Aneurinibacillus danicus]GEN34176.1 oxidoreductase [Aneurinibacillus danicus]